MSSNQLEIVDRDTEYYLEGGDVVFLVQNTLFCVHRFFLTRESPVFRDMLSLPVPKGVEVEGSSDKAPIQLQGITSDDFAKFLWTFYNELSEYDGVTIKEWLGVLRLAHMWECDNVRELAFRELEKLKLPPLERVIVGRDYDAPPEWMRRAKEALADRHTFITEDEARSLGATLAITIAALRERRRDMRHGIYPLSPPSPRPISMLSRTPSQTPPPVIVQPPHTHFLPHYTPPTPPGEHPQVLIYPGPDGYFGH
ncbi:hypothetical protein SCHPADRAFT_825284 [Schizopora paradoxa]|uniref:BTB domain-containing protein n=1 Tax=Schizopora paradoxa TaxID=27342 RepID=A0A0H2RTE9_9AGAM|nr:hypothetical protein SCHPADRAFT_825284 [Schizopora paradoxa]